MSRSPSQIIALAPPEATSLVVLTERPAVYEFFGGLGVPAWRLELDASLVARHANALVGAKVAVVDFGLDPHEAVETCLALRAHDRRLTLVAVVCCPHAITPYTVRALAGVGVTAMLDLQLSREQAVRSLRATMRGEAVLHLSFGGRRRAMLTDILGGRRLRGDDVRLLELVALGLTDHEIGGRMHISPHTVKKRIEYLRDEIGARNRTELAAWAGRQGLYAVHEHGQA